MTRIPEAVMSPTTLPDSSRIFTTNVSESLLMRKAFSLLGMPVNTLSSMNGAWPTSYDHSRGTRISWTFHFGSLWTSVTRILPLGYRWNPTHMGRMADWITVVVMGVTLVHLVAHVKSFRKESWPSGETGIRTQGGLYLVFLAGKSQSAALRTSPKHKQWMKRGDQSTIIHCLRRGIPSIWFRLGLTPKIWLPRFIYSIIPLLLFTWLFLFLFLFNL